MHAQVIGVLLVLLYESFHWNVRYYIASVFLLLVSPNYIFTTPYILSYLSVVHLVYDLHIACLCICLHIAQLTLLQLPSI